MSKYIDTEVRVDAVVEYDYTKGTPDRRDEPGDEPRAEILAINIEVPVMALLVAFDKIKHLRGVDLKAGQTVTLDISGALTRTEYDGIVGDCYTDAESEE